MNFKKIRAGVKNTSAFFIFGLGFVAEKFQIAIFKLKTSEQVIMVTFFKGGVIHGFFKFNFSSTFGRGSAIGFRQVAR